MQLRCLKEMDQGLQGCWKQPEHHQQGQLKAQGQLEAQGCLVQPSTRQAS